MNIKEKTLQGLTWNFISQGGKQVSQLIITVILARMLAPGDFGLMGMATVFSGFAAIFNDMGLSGALIHKQDIDETHLSTAFWFQVAAGALLMALMILTAPFIAKFYRKPLLEPMLVVMSCNFVLASLTIVQQTILTKDLDFKKLALRDICATIIAGIVGILAAYAGRGAWSLVYQMLAFTVADGIFLWHLSKWRPSFTFSGKVIKEIFNFSAHLTGSNILYYFSRNIDYLLIGKFLGAEPLGYYTLAYKIMLVPMRSISWVITKVLFPAFSKIQGDLERIRNAYLKTVKAIALVTFPMMFFIIGIAPEFIKVFFGKQWEPAIILIQILSVCGAVQSTVSLSASIYLSQGRADVQFRMLILASVISSAAIVLGLRWGILGVSICYTLQGIIYAQLALYVLRRIIGIDSKLFYKQLVKPLMISGALLTALIAFHFFVRLPSRSMLAYSVMLSAILYGGLLLATKEIVFVKHKISLSLLN